MQKYLFLFLIPAFFTLSSCQREPSVRPEGFFDFTAQIEPQQAEHIEEPKQEVVPFVEVEEEIKPKSKQKEVKKEEEEEPVVEETEKVIKSKTQEVIKDSKRYNIGYLTFDVADFYGEVIPLNSTKDYTRYQFRFYSRTNGFVDYLFGWISHTISIVKMYDNKVVPEKFRTKAVLKKKTREISIDYDASGRRITHEEVIPPDNRGKRPAVPDDMKLNTYDPLAMAFEARRMIMSAFKNDNFNDRKKYSFNLPMYDGRRRSDMKFELDKEKTQGLYHLKIIQHPVAGYTNNEWDDIKKGTRSMDLFIDPKTFWPVSGTGKSGVGSARAHFVQDCNMKFEECLKLSDEKRK